MGPSPFHVNQPADGGREWRYRDQAKTAYHGFEYLCGNIVEVNFSLAR